MNAQDDASFSAIIKEEQQEWAKKVLAENKALSDLPLFIAPLGKRSYRIPH